MIRALVLSLLPLWAFAEVSQSPQQLLESVAQAARQQNYQGTIVMASDSHWQSMSVQHALINGQEYERLQQLTGMPQEYIMRGSEQLCSHADNLALHRPLKNPLRTPTPNLQQDFAYDFTYGVVQRLAGRLVQQLNVQPQDNNRYGLTLWLDQETNLLLGVDLLDSQNHVLERTHYADIKTNTLMVAEDFVPSMPAHNVQEAVPAENKVESVSWIPNWLPVGFHVTYAQEKASSIRLMYFDGITAFSVYIDQSASAPTLEKQWGATAAVVMPIIYENQVHRVTAVGEVPLQTLRQVVLSVRPNLAESTAE